MKIRAIRGAQSELSSPTFWIGTTKKICFKWVFIKVSFQKQKKNYALNGLFLIRPKNQKRCFKSIEARGNLFSVPVKITQCASNQVNPFTRLIHLLAQSSVKFANLSRNKHIIFFINY